MHPQYNPPPAKADTDRDVNLLIMDYLIKEGYPSAAEKFAKEANIEMQPDSSAIEQRVQIRKAILRGDLQNAIELINDLNIEVRPHLLPSPILP
jgi:glucose-induced degradation protein 8